MELQVNGQGLQVSNNIKTVADLLASFNLADKVVVVEINGEILVKAAHSKTPVADGDRIEIVHFVGGG